MKVMILGHKGMLGNAIVKFYNSQDIDIVTCQYRWPTPQFKAEVENFDGEFIINCMAAIPQRTNNFTINYELPKYLSSLDKKIIHPDTDCIFDGKSKVPYEKYITPNAESEYGRSKAKALTYLRDNTKVIRTCIIGLDDNNQSLLSWFFGMDKVNGFTNHYMNCITTYEWAKLSLILINQWDTIKQFTQVGTKCVSKHDLLVMANEVFEKNIKITPIKHPININRCLVSDLPLPHIKTQLIELKKVYNL